MKGFPAAFNVQPKKRSGEKFFNCKSHFSRFLFISSQTDCLTTDAPQSIQTHPVERFRIGEQHKSAANNLPTTHRHTMTADAAMLGGSSSELLCILLSQMCNFSSIYIYFRHIDIMQCSAFFMYVPEWKRWRACVLLFRTYGWWWLGKIRDCFFLAFVCFDGGGCYAAAAMDVRKGIATPAATEQQEELSFTRRYSVVPPTTSSITDLNVLLRSTGNFGGCGFTGGGVALVVFPLPPSPTIWMFGMFVVSYVP